MRLSGGQDSESCGRDPVRKQRAVDTRSNIIEKAARLFAYKGYDGCSMRDIASAADVSHANIRYHFGEKEALWLQVVKHLIAESYRGNELLVSITDNANPMEIFRQHTREVISYFAYHPELPRIVHFEMIIGGARYEKVRGWMRDLEAERVSHVTSMQENGVVKPEIDPHQLNTFISGALTNIFVANPEFDCFSKSKKEQLIEQYTELIVSMVSA